MQIKARPEGRQVEHKFFADNDIGYLIEWSGQGRNDMPGKASFRARPRYRTRLARHLHSV